MFRRLLVPLDQSDLAEEALGRAAAIARASAAEVDLVLVRRPVPFVGIGDKTWDEHELIDDHKYLEQTVAELATGAALRSTHGLLRGDAVEMICARAHDVGSDLIVMTSHGRTGLSRAWLGSTADGVIRNANVPVLMFRPMAADKDRRAAHHLFKRVLVPIDGSALSAEILPAATALARCSGARLTLLRIVPWVTRLVFDAALPLGYIPSLPDEPATKQLVSEAKAQLAETAAALANQDIGRVDTHVVVGGPVPQAILDFARGMGVDVIAMSSHGYGASRLLFGSTADKVLRDGCLPMLLYRPAAGREVARESSALALTPEFSLA